MPVTVQCYGVFPLLDGGTASDLTLAGHSKRLREGIELPMNALVGAGAYVTPHPCARAQG